MGKYAREADNVAKSCKSRGSHLRVHFKVRSLSIRFAIVRLCAGNVKNELFCTMKSNEF